MTIQPATYSDIEAICDLEGLVYQKPWSQQDFQHSLQDKDLIWLLTTEQSLVGMVMARIIGDEAEIFRISVHPKQQGQGYGRQLLEYLLVQLSQLDCQKIFLEVRPSLVAALKLYHAAGFKQISVRKNYYSNRDGTHEDAIIMEKIINELS